MIGRVKRWFLTDEPVRSHETYQGIAQNASSTDEEDALREKLVANLARYRAQAEERLLLPFGQPIPRGEPGESAYVKRHMDRGRREVLIELAEAMGLQDEVRDQTGRYRHRRRR